MKLIQARNFFENDIPYPSLYINSCGYFSELDRDTYCDRPNGRDDYQIIYMLEGEMEYVIDGKSYTAPKGSLILYKPNEPQIYGCRAEKRSAYIWVHFGGEHAEQLLRECGLYDKNCYYLPSYRGGERTVKKMIAEICRKQPSYQIKLASLFTSLLCEFSRSDSEDNSAALQKLGPALESMENSPRLDTRVSEYAAMCHMSEFHFLHEFKSLMGTSPISYRDDVIMRKACILLDNTAMPVGEIATSLGTSDALYFSKKFKKHVGMSPSRYRERK
jgi:AraC-like DNA-binding protein